MSTIEAYKKQRAFAEDFADLAHDFDERGMITRPRVDLTLRSIEYGYIGATGRYNFTAEQLAAIKDAIEHNLRAIVKMAAEHELEKANQLAREAKREAIEVIAIVGEVDSESDAVV